MTRQQLRAYQQADVDLTMQRRRILYASKCGVGKTLPAVRSVEQAQCFPALVSAPTYLIDQWNDFLLEEGYTPNEIVVAATSATRNGKIVQIGPDEKRALLEHAAHDPRVKWLVVNHEMLRQPPAQREKSVQTIWKETQQEMGWDNIVPSPTRTSRPPNRYRMPHTLRSLIIDESHRLRGSGPSGRGSQQFRGAYQIATRSRIQGQLKTQQEPGLVIEMTATPIYKDVMDLYNQLRLIDPHHFTSRWAFLNAYATYDEDDWGTIVTGATPQAQTLLSRYAIIRDYSDPDVEIDIPPPDSPYTSGYNVDLKPARLRPDQEEVSFRHRRHDLHQLHQPARSAKKDHRHGPRETSSFRRTPARLSTGRDLHLLPGSRHLFGRTLQPASFNRG